MPNFSLPSASFVATGSRITGFCVCFASSSASCAAAGAGSQTHRSSVAKDIHRFIETEVGINQALGKLRAS